MPAGRGETRGFLDPGTSVDVVARGPDLPLRATVGLPSGLLMPADRVAGGAADPVHCWMPLLWQGLQTCHFERPEVSRRVATRRWRDLRSRDGGVGRPSPNAGRLRSRLRLRFVLKRFPAVVARSPDLPLRATIGLPSGRHSPNVDSSQQESPVLASGVRGTSKCDASLAVRRPSPGLRPPSPGGRGRRGGSLILEHQSMFRA